MKSLFVLLSLIGAIAHTQTNIPLVKSDQSGLVQLDQTALGLALRKASYKGELADVKTLIGNGARVNGTSTVVLTPLMLASAKGHIEVVEFLLSKNAIVYQPTKEDKLTALKFAANYA